MSTLNFISYFDFISPDNSLYYKNNLRHKNPFSGIVFFFIILGSGAIVTYFLLKFLQRSEFVTYTYDKNEDKPTRLYFDYQGLYHYIQLGQNPPPIDFRSVSIVAVRTNIYNYNNGRDFENNDFWVMGPCDDIDYEQVKDYLDPTIKFFNGACLNKMYNHTDKTIYDKSDKEFTFPYFVYGGDYAYEEQYSLVLEKCRNESDLTRHNLIEKNSCRPENEINEYLNKVQYISFGIIDSNADVGNYKNPIHKYFLRIENTCVPGGTVVINHLNYYPGVLDTNDGYIFDNSKIESFYYYKLNEKATVDRKEQQLDEAILVEFAIWIKTTINVYNRKYSNLFDAMASIGGLTDFLFFLGKFINFIYYDFVLYHDFFQLFFDYFYKHNESYNKNNNEIRIDYNSDKEMNNIKFNINKNNDTSNITAQIFKLKKLNDKNFNNSINNVNNYSRNNLVQNSNYNLGINFNSNNNKNTQSMPNNLDQKKKLKSINTFHAKQWSVNKMNFSTENIKNNLSNNFWYFCCRRIKINNFGKNNIYIRRHIFSEEFLFQLYFMTLEFNKKCNLDDSSFINELVKESSNVNNYIIPDNSYFKEESNNK